MHQNLRGKNEVLPNKRKTVDVESMAKIVSGEISLIEYASTHSMEECEDLRKPLERGERIGEKPQVMSDISAKIVEQAMAINTTTNPRGLLDLKERLEREAEEQ